MGKVETRVDGSKWEVVDPALGPLLMKCSECDFSRVSHTDEDWPEKKAEMKAHWKEAKH